MEITYKKILVPIDFSDFSKNAFKYSLSFAKQHNAAITLVYVMEPVFYPPDLSLGQITLPAVDLDMEGKAREELEKVADLARNEGVAAATIIKMGKPFVEIIDTAREEDSDLIIISTHGHSGMEQILFGSTADKVVRKAPCPVLVIRDPIKGFNYKEAKG
ncbi:MAG: universal stress protein [Ignavibacteriaceae bacterium]|nr:universal stress protein [Ignavibacteriaceae bacterium]